ncbi:MAG TPA: YicC/YloC family endoribonuclease [Pirellulaceae bacterium]|nr:YicC/YloC family endoribonuclease [Pirellulaceae bacterium]
MLLSMTGHGAAQQQADGISVAADVRTVNSRFFKLSTRSNEAYGGLDSRVDETVRSVIRRGTVQVDLRIERESEANVLLNESVLASYCQQLQSFRNTLDGVAPLQVELLLALPGVINDSRAVQQDVDAVWPVVKQTLTEALEGLSKMRAAEGQAMAADLEVNCRDIKSHLEQIEARAPLVVDSYRERLTDRINKMLAEHDVQIEPVDVIREVGIYAERSDIAEETVRLHSHLVQFRKIMTTDESQGKKLEFVTQEMFRETNTIGSKANDAEITANVIDIKAAIERIREMIQNIE